MLCEQAPGYSRVITRPMDFATMWGRHQGGAYLGGWSALRDDMDTMFKNAMIFNAPDTVYHKQACALHLPRLPHVHGRCRCHAHLECTLALPGCMEQDMLGGGLRAPVACLAATLVPSRLRTICWTCCPAV